MSKNIDESATQLPPVAVNCALVPAGESKGQGAREESQADVPGQGAGGGEGLILANHTTNLKIFFTLEPP